MWTFHRLNDSHWEDTLETARYNTVYTCIQGLYHTLVYSDVCHLSGPFFQDEGIHTTWKSWGQNKNHFQISAISLSLFGWDQTPF